jgi:hypothetical protein
VLRYTIVADPVSFRRFGQRVGLVIANRRSHSQLAEQLATAYGLSDVLVSNPHTGGVIIFADGSSSLAVRQDFDSQSQILGPCFVRSVQIRKFFDSQLCEVFRPCHSHNTFLDAGASDFCRYRQLE